MKQCQYITNMAIKSAGYKSITAFCKKHNININTIQQHNFRHKKNDCVHEKVDLILRAERAEKELQIIKDVLNKKF